ncbi:MAG: phage integrase N-terminal SAM-like domain-containing protein [Pseudomonadota bacterium]
MESQSERDYLREEKDNFSAEIVNSAPCDDGKWNSENEKIVFEYQRYLNKYAPPTSDQHLAAIRKFEAFIREKSFTSISDRDADTFRKHLADQAQQKLSRSTVRHEASYLRSFYDWLVKTKHGKKLPGGISGYFELPSHFLASANQPQPSAYPTRDEVEAMLKVRARALKEQRDLAILATCFLTGMRADAVASLRVKAVDPENLSVFQDGISVRTKRGKQMHTAWFPVCPAAERIVRSWLQRLLKLGAKPEDALFPPDQWLETPRRIGWPNREDIQCWASATPIRSAFHWVCEEAGIKYFTPHSAKHFLASVKDEFCRTREERKAWSVNLGHENETITETNYARMSQEEARGVFQNMRGRPTLSHEDKDLYIALLEATLTPGTPEHERALKIRNSRMLSGLGHGGPTTLDA